MRGECRAHGHLGAVHLSLGNFLQAAKCHQEQLDRARDIRDPKLEAGAHAALGLAATALGRHEDAIGSFEQQLAALEQLGAAAAANTTSGEEDKDLDRGRAFGNLGTCYRALGDEDEAVKWLDKYLSSALQSQSSRDQDKAYRELGAAHKTLGNLQQALVREKNEKSLLCHRFLIVNRSFFDFDVSFTSLC